MNEVYPWSPAVKDHDRANVHLYRLTGYVIRVLSRLDRQNLSIDYFTLSIVDERCRCCVLLLVQSFRVIHNRH